MIQYIYNTPTPPSQEATGAVPEVTDPAIIPTPPHTVQSTEPSTGEEEHLRQVDGLTATESTNDIQLSGNSPDAAGEGVAWDLSDDRRILSLEEEEFSKKEAELDPEVRDAQSSLASVAVGDMSTAVQQPIVMPNSTHSLNIPIENAQDVGERLSGDSRSLGKEGRIELIETGAEREESTAGGNDASESPRQVRGDDMTVAASVYQCRFAYRGFPRSSFWNFHL